MFCAFNIYIAYNVYINEEFEILPRHIFENALHCICLLTHILIDEFTCITQ